ncbi:MAG: acyltransferase [Bacteroidales bacterium]|nr:acyltransferase [Bacteroidales bacterium]
MTSLKNPKFDDIRPYYEEEIPAAMKRIAASGPFNLMSSYVFPDRDVESVRELLSELSTVEEFQRKVMYEANRQIIAKTITEFSYSGMEKLSPSKNYLFVSNHRDIMLDASLLQNVFVDCGFDTSEITFGANLMSSPTVIDIGKSNKMFKVERCTGSTREFYLSSLHLSEYIRYTLLEKKQSVWIAQRNGRTKDGNDLTEPGLIKMFGMSRTDDKIASLSELNIVPVAVSYEWEPCDVLKVLELYESSKMAYVKKPGEDLNSILTGIVAFKGRVHFSVCDPIRPQELSKFRDLTLNNFNKEVASLIDKRIFREYRLWPNNFIAHDLLYATSEYRDRYTEAERKAFINHCHKLAKYEVDAPELLKEKFLGIYANPVDNCLLF